jgi:sulfur carrier protein
MTRLFVNGEPVEFSAAATVADVVDGFCSAPAGVAVAVNREVVPRGQWATTPLRAGDRVEIVSAAPGG